MRDTQFSAAPHAPHLRQRSEHGQHGRRGQHGHHGRGFGRAGGWQQGELPDASDCAAWFSGRLPSGWFTGPVSVTVDREEITVIGTLPNTDDIRSTDEDDTSETSNTDRAFATGRVARFREQTREQRVQIAQEAQERYGRSVAWGVQNGEELTLFSHLAVPVMTRLRQSERQVLDTLIDAGIARSRADALTWTVKLAGEHSAAWLAQLREAMADVDAVRSAGPQL